MATEMKAMKSRNYFAVGLVGFSASFAVFLVRQLWTKDLAPTAELLNLAAAVLLGAVCALCWPQVLKPQTATVKPLHVGLVVPAIALALDAPSPAASC